MAVSSRIPAQIFATPIGCTMKFSPLARRWSACRSQEKTNARSTGLAIDLLGAIPGVLLHDREQVAEERPLVVGELRLRPGGGVLFVAIDGAMAEVGSGSLPTRRLTAPRLGLCAAPAVGTGGRRLLPGGGALVAVGRSPRPAPAVRLLRGCPLGGGRALGGGLLGPLLGDGLSRAARQLRHITEFRAASSPPRIPTATAPPRAGPRAPTTSGSAFRHARRARRPPPGLNWPAGVLAELVHRLVERHRGAGGAVGGHRVEGVAAGDDRGLDRDGVALQAVRIAAAVPTSRARSGRSGRPR